MRNYVLSALAVLTFVVSCVSDAYAESKTQNRAYPKLLDKATKDKLLELKDAAKEMHGLSGMMGKWNFDLKYWGEEDSEPQLSNGVTSSEFIFGNKFISSKSSAILNMNGENIPYENWNIIAYDAHKKVFTSVFMDVLSATIINGTIDYDDKIKVFTEKGRFTNPFTGKEQAYRGELNFIGSRGYVRSFFINNTKGQEFKVLEITYYRKR